jgi:protein SCO1/2
MLITKLGAHRCLVVCLLMLPAATACANRPPVSGPEAAVQTTVYHGVGVVKSIDPQRETIELDHEDIKGLMPAMTMSFYVKDALLLKDVKTGQRVKFTIENGVGGLKITDIGPN